MTTGTRPGRIHESREQFFDARPGEGAMPAEGKTTGARGEPPADFFMAVDAAMFGSGSLYRVYPEADALVFLRVGMFFGPLGVEVGRKGRSGHWLASAADTAKPVLSGAAVVFLVILIILLRIVIRGGAPVGEALDFLLLVVLAIGLPFFLATLWFIRGSLKRAAALDAMSAEERRAEPERDHRNRVLTAGDIAEASLDKAAGGWGTDKLVPAKLTLNLRPKGKFKLRLQNRRDVKAAARAVKRLIGTKHVAVSIPLKGNE